MTTQSIRYISRVHLDRKMNTDMGKRRQFSHKEFLIIYIAVYHLQDAGGYRQLLLSVGYVIVTSFQRVQYGGLGDESDSMEENLTNTPQSGDKVNVSDSHTDNRYP